MTKITKTNIRVNSDFIIKDDEEKYYITDVSVLKKYKKMSDDDLSNFIKDNNDVTDKIEKLYTCIQSGTFRYLDIYIYIYIDR